MGWIGTSEIIIIFAAAFILFGPKRLPELGRFLGKTIRQLREFSAGISLDELIKGTDEEEKKEVVGKEMPEEIISSPDVIEPMFKEEDHRKD